jgi:hypothetical protein
LISLFLGATAASLSIAACGSPAETGTGGSAGSAGGTTSGGAAGAGVGGGTTGSTTTDTATTTDTGGGGAGGGTTTGETTSSTTTTTTTMMDPWAGPLQALALLDLGTIPFNLQKTFPVPDKTLGFTVQLEGLQPSNVVGVYRLRPPVGGSVILNFAMAGHTNQVFGGQQFIGAADAQSDSSDAYPVQSGSWKLTPGSDGQSGSNCNARVWVRRTNDGAFHGGALDVNLIVVPGAATAAYLDKVLAAFFPYAGIAKGTVDSYGADSSYATLESYDEYHKMLTTTAGIASAPAVNLFVVDDFADAAFGGAIGVAGGIPGSPMRHGTTQSGLAYVPTGDPNYDASLLMHEIGHLGGLFHTTEFAITETDPLTDTPECPADTIKNTPDQCPDKSNTMFPIAYGAKQFTPAQLNVLHGSALYRGILDEGGSPAAPLSVVASGNPLPQFVDDPLPAGALSMPAAPDPLERALGSLWCSGGLDRAALGVARDPSVKLARATAKTASARLRAIAVDETVPVLLRRRALRLYLEAARAEGLAAEAQALELVLSIAGRTSVTSIAERRLQTTALRLLRAARASARTSASALFTKRIDAVLAAAASSGDALLSAVARGN